MSRSRIEPTLAAVVTILGASLPLSTTAQTVVYDNTANNLHAIHSTGEEYGDQIVLAGDSTLRTATAFELIYYSNYNLAQGGVVRLYANDGPLVGGYSSPGELLYQSAAFDIQKSDSSDPNNVVGRTLSINLANTGLVVPDKLTWTVSFSGTSSGANEAGVLVYDPPTVGSAGELFWKRNGPIWALTDLGNNVNGNFAAKLTAIPEPSTVALGSMAAIGWLALAGYRRSKK